MKTAITIQRPCNINRSGKPRFQLLKCVAGHIRDKTKWQTSELTAEQVAEFTNKVLPRKKG